MRSSPILDTPKKKWIALILGGVSAVSLYLLFSNPSARDVRSRMLTFTASDDTPAYDWPSGEPGDIGLDESALERIANSWGEDTRAHSLLIAKDGKLYFEKYFNGWTAAAPNPTRSVGKLWVTTLAGVALQKGLLKNLNTPVSEYIPEAYAKLSKDDQRREVTFEDLMTMRSGYRYPDARIGRVFQSDDWLSDVVNGWQTGRRGEQFFYSTSQTHLLAGALTAAVGEPLYNFATRELCEPLGISIRAWNTDPQGIHFGGSDMKVRPRDLLRLGDVYMKNGTIEGHRILPEGFIDDSYVNRRSLGKGSGFGYSWWLSETALETIRIAYGRGGQSLTLYPDSGFMVVTTCGIQSNGIPRSKVTRLLTEDLPAIFYANHKAPDEAD